MGRWTSVCSASGEGTAAMESLALSVMEHKWCEDGRVLVIVDNSQAHCKRGEGGRREGSRKQEGGDIPQKEVE